MLNNLKGIEDKQLGDWILAAENRCFGYLKNESDAQDISQSVIIELMLNYHNISKPEAWIMGTSRRKCFEFMRNKKAYHKMLGTLKAEMSIVSEIELHEMSHADSMSYRTLIERIPDKKISQQNKTFFMDYVNSDFNTEYLKSKYGLKTEAIRKRLYNIRKDITAYLNQYRGIRSGKRRIVGAHLNVNIQKFIERFKQCFENNDWQPIESYLAPGIAIPEDFYIPFYDNVKFDVTMNDQGDYRVVIVYGTEEKVSAYDFHFNTLPPNKIQITRFPQPVKKMMHVSLDGIDPRAVDFLKKLAKNADQVIYKDIIKELKKYHIKLDELTLDYQKDKEK